MKNCPRTMKIVAVVILSAIACAAQQSAAPSDTPKADPQTQAIEPDRPTDRPLYGAPTDAADAEVTSVPDTRPLSGILGLTLGSLQPVPNTFMASFRFGQVFDSNSGIQGSQSDYTGESSFGANLRLHRTGARQALDIGYSGNLIVYNDTRDLLSSHQLNFAEVLNTGRWTVTFTDAFNYSPQGNLGAGLGFDNLGSGSVSLGGTNSLMKPDQSIYTPLLRQLMNTVGAQVQYGLSPRSSWTVAATYGNLYYPDREFGNTHQINARAGYNRNWTAQDTVSIFYDYGAYRGSSSFGSEADSHSMQLAYARRVTGRLTWSISAGPQIAKVISSDGTSVSWTASTTLQYQRARTAFSFGFSRGAGVGVLGAMRTDSLQAGVTRTVTRRWSIGASGELSRSPQLGGTAEFKTGFAGAQVQRTLGERASLYFNYGFQRQISDGTCAGALCASLSRQVFGFGFDWTPWRSILR